MRRNLLLLALFVLTGTCAHSQWAAGVAFTSQHITLQGDEPPGQQNSHWILGPSFSFNADFGTTVAGGFDTRVSLLNGGGVNANSATIGPRVSFKVPVVGKVYGEYLLGVMNVRPPGSSKHTGHIDNVYVVGFDHKVSPRLDWRVVEYAYSRVFSLGGYANEDIRHQISSGVLFRF